MTKLVLGRGKVFFQPYPKNATSGGVRGYLGNTPGFTVAQSTTMLEHYSSESGLKVKDLAIPLQVDMTLTIDCDNIDTGNLVLWFGGATHGTEPTDAPTDIGDIQFFASSRAVFGALYFLADNPIGDNRNYWWPYVSMRPNGNYSLKGDALQTLQFTIEALKRPDTDRMLAYVDPTGASIAATDTTPLISGDEASVFGNLFASSAALTVPSSGVPDTPFDVSYTLNGGTAGDDLMAYLFVHDGSVIPASRTVIVGASGTVPITYGGAAVITIEAFTNTAGTGSPITTSSTIDLT